MLKGKQLLLLGDVMQAAGTRHSTGVDHFAALAKCLATVLSRPKGQFHERVGNSAALAKRFATAA